MAHYTTNDFTNFSNNQNSFNVSNNYMVSDDRCQLLSWLSPLEPSLRHRDLRERRVNAVGEWLIRTAEFRKWRGLSGEGEGDSPVLFCFGDPGAGKTFISSLVVDRLCDRARGQDTAVTCFYFDFAARKEQSVTNMLGSLVKQIVSGMERIPEEVWRTFQEQKKAIGGCGPQLADLVKMLQAVTSSQPTFVCIDALDECVGVQRMRVLDSFKQIIDRSPGIRIFVTGRPHVQAEMERRLAIRIVSVAICPTRGDIIGYLRARLGEDETPDAMDAGLEAEILMKIPENISEMFLLVSLRIDSILQESTIFRRRERLRKMTDGLGLGNAYGASIERIKAQGGDRSRLGVAALMWVSHAERPLSVDELCHALAVELGSTDFNAENIPSMSTLVSCCQGLITVGEEASTVRLIHFTLQEYLSARSDTFCQPHATMAEICLTYLNSTQVNALPANLPDTSDIPFLDYSSLYWGTHAKKELSDNARSLALELLQKYGGHISARILLEPEGLESLDLEDFGTGFSFSGLHCASFLGIDELVASMIDMEGYDINEQDHLDYSPLLWAIYNGHEGVAKLLLQRNEVKPDQPNFQGFTPLHFAAESGYEETVKMLLEREEVNPDRPAIYGITPLMGAATGGYEGIVKMLLGRTEVNPEKQTGMGTTALFMACSRGHERIVKILLATGVVNAGRADNYSKTPLSSAVENGLEGIVKVLLTREDVDPGKPDKVGRTPLSLAAGNGYEGIVKVLLTREDVDPGKPDEMGRTPLSLAAGNGLEGIVKVLLTREDSNPSKSDRIGRTPLQIATTNRHRRVVELLQPFEAVFHRPLPPETWPEILPRRSHRHHNTSLSEHTTHQSPA